MKKTKQNKIISLLVVILSGLILIYAGLNIFSWAKDNMEIKKENIKIKENVKVEKVKKGNNINPDEDKESDYWKYIKLPLMSVDFSKLLKDNSDTVAFIKVNGTNINYPVVQTSDNSYYLTHAFDKTYNEAGWVFLDYRNKIDDFSVNNVIYAHSRIDTTMFGSLKNIFKTNWYENTDNHVIYLSTPKKNTLWQVFSVYSIPTENYYLTTNFGSEKSHQKFINTITKRSRFIFKANVNEKDKILTLSTCYNKKEKVVLHAKLIKEQIR